METATTLSKVNPKMLTLAREARGLSQAELAEKLKVNQSNLSRMELEAIGISDATAKDLKKILDLPSEFFHQDADILPPAYYRKREKVPGKILSVIEANVNIYSLQIDKLLVSMKKEPFALPDLNPTNTGSPAASAKQLRKLWKVPTGPVENLTEILEKQGIIVVSFDFGTERVDSRSTVTNQGYPVIFINSSMLGDRRRFSLAYELGHLMMHIVTPPPFGTEVSREANQFAAELLMPEKDIKKDLSDGLDMVKLGELKKKWKVSMQAIIYRAHDLELITDNQKRYIIAQFNALKIRRREPAALDVQKETPSLLRNLVSQYRTRQKMTVTEMARFLFLNQEEFIKRLSPDKN